MTNLKETLYNVACALVETPDEVTVLETVDGDTVNLVLSVAADDMGMVIGKHGKIAKAIRTVMKAAAVIADVHVRVDILDKDELDAEGSSEEN